nr:hypothetical protein A6C57_01325 [Fibrella sp. ES10-3-2-2]
MHDLLDQLTQWITDVRAEMPARNEGDTTEAAPTSSLPLVNLGAAITKLKTTPALAPQIAPVKSAEEVTRELTLERLDRWVSDIDHLDPACLDDWHRQRAMLKPYVSSGYAKEAAEALEVLIERARPLGIAYNRSEKTFYFTPQPETVEEADGHPY